MNSKTRIINTMRNTVLLSLLLGLTWVMALLPTSLVQQYISVILNGSMGMYIFGQSSLALTRERKLCPSIFCHHQPESSWRSE